DARATEPADRASRIEPLVQDGPGRIALEQRPGDGSVRNPRPRERAGDLRDAAGGAVREPLAGGHRLVVERARRLHVEDDHRRRAVRTTTGARAAGPTGSTCAGGASVAV